MPPQRPECQEARGRRWPLGGSGMGPLGGSGTCGGADTAGRSELCWWATCTPTARCEAAHAVPLGWLGGSGGHGTHPQHQVSGDQAHRGWAGHFCVTWGEGPQGHALPRRPQTLLCTPGKLATDQRPHSRRKERQPGEGRGRFPQRMEGTDFTEMGVTGHTQQSQVHEDLIGAHLWKWPRVGESAEGCEPPRGHS